MFWPASGSDRIAKAIQAYMCVKCLGGEHTYCPAAEIICGVNRCVQHHDPFFHEGRARDLRGEGSGDSWKDLQEAHKEWTQREEKTYQEHQLSARHEKVRVMEQLGSQQAMKIRYASTLARLPPYTIKRTANGEIIMPERTFRMLAESYEHAGHMAKQLTMSALRQLLLQMDKGIRQNLLADELSLDRNNPVRGRMLTQEEGETDESYAFRLAKRSVALEINPPTAVVDPEATTETSENSESESEESSDSGSGNEAPGRRNGVLGRPMLSGNPYEGDYTDMTPNN